MKTIEEWLEDLPEPAQSEALKNTHRNNLTDEVDSMHEAINLAFDWEETPEGRDYWDDIYELYKQRKEPMTKSEIFRFRITPELRKSAEKQAKKAGLKLSEFIRFLLQREVSK